MNTSCVFITTSIPYVNAQAHVGHAQEFVLADALARLHRFQGRSVVLQTGTDENAFKNVLSARRQGIDPLEFVSLNAAKFRSLADALRVSYDTFIRTTEERHAKGVRLFWSSLKKEDIYSKSYSGLYCQGCEDFYLEKDLDDGVCPDHKTRPIPIEEKNVFFRLSAYQKNIEDAIVNDEIRIVPSSRKNEILSFVRSGLQDISLTRNADRSGGWGIKVPDDSRQVIYVWIDALVNYLSGQGYGESEKWRDVWSEKTHKVHVIGKNVWKFHAVYWPALLLSAGLPVPNEIVIHGFLTVEGQKISKSLGNAIDPVEVIDKYGVDAFRNYLLSDLSVYGDADFSDEGVRQSHNANLANNIGNLVSRLAALCRKAGCSPDVSELRRPSPLLPAEGFSQGVQQVIQQVWDRLSEINGEINEKRPWELIKNGDDVSVERLLCDWLGKLHDASRLLSCFLPTAGERVVGLLESGISKNDVILFPKLD